jgi:hypothetical protein
MSDCCRWTYIMCLDCHQKKEAFSKHSRPSIVQDSSCTTCGCSFLISLHLCFISGSLEGVIQNNFKVSYCWISLLFQKQLTYEAYTVVVCLDIWHTIIENQYQIYCIHEKGICNGLVNRTVMTTAEMRFSGKANTAIEWLLFNANHSNCSAILWREQVNLQGNDDEVHLVLEQHT